MVCLRNRVLVKSDPELRRSNIGLDIVDETYGSTAPVWGMVITPPKILDFNIALENLWQLSGDELEAAQRSHTRSLEYSPNVELLPGDEVLYSYIMNVDNEDEAYEDRILVPYDMIYARRRNGEITTLNGNLLVELLPSPIESIGSFQIITDEFQKNKGIVKYLGPRVQYKEKDYVDLSPDVRSGDIIQFDDKMSARVEWDLFNTMSSNGHPLVRVNRKDVYFQLK